MGPAAATVRAEGQPAPRWVVDVGLAAALLLTAQLLTWPAMQVVDHPPPSWVVMVAAGLVYGPLVWWRRRPLLALVVASVGFLIHGHYPVPEGVFVVMALFILLVGAGAYGDGRWRTPVRAVCVVILNLQVVISWLAPGLYQVRAGDTLARSDDPTVLLGWALYNGLVFVGSWLLGNAVYARRLRERELAARTTELADRTAELETEREANALKAVVEERLRIARELHDVVAHHLSIIGLQAGAAGRVLERDPQQARAALRAVESASGAAVTELQRLLVLLRSDEDADERAPQPSLDRLGELVAQVSLALQVDLTIQGEPRPVPPSVGVAAFRIAQEALTNTLRHADATRAEVIVRYRETAVELEILDDGCGADRTTVTNGDGLAGAERGHGLLGMRERVAMHDGRFEAGQRQGGGFRVWARLPIGTPSPAPQPAGVAQP